MWRPFTFRARTTTKRRRPSPARRAVRPGLESLEGRVVLSAVFDSVLGVGGDTASIAPRDNAVDSAGNTYVIGTLYGTIDLDPGVVRADGSDILTPRGSTDAFVAKYAPDNSLVWARRMGSDALVANANGPYEVGEAIALDGAGNVYVTGDFVGSADFGPITLTGAGSLDAFVAKLDANGTFLWANRWGEATHETAGGIAIDAGGNVIAVGTTGTAFSNGSWTPNAFEVRKFTPGGSTVWVKRVNAQMSYTGGVATDAAGNVFVCGGFRGTADFNPDPKKTNSLSGATAQDNAYVLKLTASGAFGWAVPFVSKTAEAANSNAYCNDIAVDGGGNVVVVGKYWGQVDFDPNSGVDTRLPVIGASYDGFVVKLAPTGSLAWATPLGGAVSNSLAIDAAGAIYVTGTFRPSPFTPGFGLPAVSSNGLADAFVVMLTPAGAVDWAVTFGGVGDELASAIAVDAAGNLYVAGSFRSTVVDFDPDPVATHELSNSYYTDMFLLKLKRS